MRERARRTARGTVAVAAISGLLWGATGTLTADAYDSPAVRAHGVAKPQRVDTASLTRAAQVPRSQSSAQVAWSVVRVVGMDVRSIGPTGVSAAPSQMPPSDDLTARAAAAAGGNLAQH